MAEDPEAMCVERYAHRNDPSWVDETGQKLCSSCFTPPSP